MKALRVNVDPYVLELAKTLDRSERNFRDLEYRHQKMLVDCPLNLEGLATEEEVRAFEIERSIREPENKQELILARTKRMINNATERIRV